MYSMNDSRKDVKYIVKLKSQLLKDFSLLSVV